MIPEPGTWTKTEIKPLPVFIRIADAEYWTGLPERSISAILGAKDLPKYKVESRTLIKLSELIEFIEKGKVEKL